MVTRICRSNIKNLQTTIQFSCALLLTGCASSIDASKDVKAAHELARKHLPVNVDSALTWNASEPLTVDEAIAYAISHDVILQRDLAIIVQRRAEIAQAELPANPTFAGSFGIAIDGLSGAPLILQGMQNLSWIWTQPDRIASAEQSLRQAILTAAHRTIEIVANVRIAYHKAVFELELTQLEKEDVELAKQLQIFLQQHQRVGEASIQDVDNANLAFIKTKHNFFIAQEKSDIAILDLLHLMGCPEKQIMPIIFDSNSIILPKQTEEKLFSFAIENRLDLAMQRAMIAQRSAELGLANPPLITSSLMLNENFADRKAIVPGAGITIALDGNAKEAIADSKLQQAELQYVDAIRNVIKEIRVLYQNHCTAVDKLRLDEKALEITLQAFARSQDESHKNEIHPISLLPISRSVIEAKKHILNDKLKLTTNAIKLEQAVGGSYRGMYK